MNELEQIQKWAEDLLQYIEKKIETIGNSENISFASSDELKEWIDSPWQLGGFLEECYPNENLSHALESQINVRVRPAVRKIFSSLKINQNKVFSYEQYLDETRKNLDGLVKILNQVLSSTPNPDVELVRDIEQKIAEIQVSDQSDRVTSISISNFKCIGGVTLHFDGYPMILTGENGTGKSSLIEAIYLLKKIMSENFQTTIEQHNGMTSITRQGTLFFSVELHAAGAQGELSYKIEIAHNKSKGYIVIQREELTLGPLKEREKPLYVIQRRGPNAKVFNQLEGRLVSVEVASHVSTLSINTLPPNQAIFRIKSVLDRILVYTPFLTSQSWLVSGSSVEARSRQPSKYQPITYVDRQGDNLANVLANLKLDHKQWSRLLDLVRIGLGSDIEDIDVTPLPAGGYVAASLRYKNNQQIPLSDISDGMMCYLLYVATQQLCLRAPPSLLMMDEIELHLHPGLIARTYLLLEELTRNNIPVLVTSHSDYLLDIVPDPIAQISVLVNDGANGSTTLALNADRYQEWLENYKGFGSMRLEGVDQFVLEER